MRVGVKCKVPTEILGGVNQKVAGGTDQNGLSCVKLAEYIRNSGASTAVRVVERFRVLRVGR